MDAVIIFSAKYLFLVILGVAFAMLWQLPSKKRLRYLIGATIGSILAVVLTKLAGLLYFDPRPFTEGVKPLIEHAADNGFPSDHTVLSVLAAALVLSVNRRVGAVLLLLAGIVGISRVLAGAHHPFDIAAGAVIGLASAGLGIFVAGKISK